jgi:hypothetical protein
MIDSMKNLTHQASGFLPTLKIDTPSNILKKVTKIAIPVLVLVGVQHAQAVEGAFFYCLCLAACVPLAEAPPLLAICIAACTPLLGLP